MQLLMQRVAQARVLTVQRALRFAPPERVYTVGSWAAKTMAQPNRTVDIALQMPASCFDEKDQLNGRYFARLAVCACFLPPGTCHPDHVLTCIPSAAQVSYMCNVGAVFEAVRTLVEVFLGLSVYASQSSLMMWAVDSDCFARRVQYLAEIAAQLRQTPEFKDISWTFLQHDAR